MTREIRNPEIEALLKDIGHKLGDRMPDKYGFSLLIFGYGDSPEMFYISSASRESMIAAMREFISKHEPN